MHDNTQTQAQPKNNHALPQPTLASTKRRLHTMSRWRRTTQQLPNNSVTSSLDSVRFKTTDQRNKTRCKCTVKLLHCKLTRRANANQAFKYALTNLKLSRIIAASPWLIWLMAWLGPCSTWDEEIICKCRALFPAPDEWWHMPLAAKEFGDRVVCC